MNSIMRSPPDGRRDWPVYAIYGLAVASDFPFAVPLPPADRAPDLHITYVTEPPLMVDWAQCTPAYTPRYRTETGAPCMVCYELEDVEVLRFAELADYYLFPDQIICHMTDPQKLGHVEIFLLGAALSRWLERRGVAMLHASAVVTGQGAIAFQAPSKKGKTTLATFLLHAGHPMLTDDILPIRFENGRIVGDPGYPQTRLWPEQIAHFLGTGVEFPRVQPEITKQRVPVGPGGLGTFCVQSQPLAAIFLPMRRSVVETGTGNADEEDPEIVIERVPSAQALFTLMRDSFATHLVNNVAHQQARLSILQHVARQVPVFRLQYPTGYAHLPRVCAAILDHVALHTLASSHGAASVSQ